MRKDKLYLSDRKYYLTQENKTNMEVKLNYAELVTILTALREHQSLLLSVFADEKSRSSFINSEIKHVTKTLNYIESKVNNNKNE